MSEFKDLQPEVCETIEQEAPPKICPTCKPDPSYIEPTWWETTEAYLNKKLCEYQVNMISTKQVSGLSQNEIKYEARKMVQEGIRAILRQTGKLETNEIVCAFPPQKKDQKCRLYIPPNLLIKLDLQANKSFELIDNIEYNKEDPEGRFNPDSLEVAAKVADIYYGDNFEVFQVLVSVPAENIDVLPESPFTNDEQEQLNETAEGIDEIVLDGYSFRSNIRKMKAAFLLYSKYQTAFAYTQNIKLSQYIDSSYRPFYLKKYRKRINAFAAELRRVAKENGFRITSVKSRRTVEKIKIRFDKNDPLTIKSIHVKKKGCPYERLRGITKLKESDKTTNNYIANLDQMIKDLSFSGEEVPWLDFMAEYTYPALEINFGDVDNNEEPLNSCIDQESVQNLKDNVLKGLFNFSEAIQFALSTNECKTLKDIAEKNVYNEQRKNLKESLEKNKKKRQQRRKDKRLSRETISEIEQLETILEDAILQGPNEEELQQIIQELQQNKTKLFTNSSKELDAIEKLKLEKKINNSIIRKLKERLKIIIGVTNNETEQQSLISEIEKLESKNKDIKEQIDELRALSKEARKKNRKAKATLTYDKLEAMTKEAYEENRKELTLFDTLIVAKETGEQQTLLEKLNPCNWDRVSMQVVECLLGGMSFEEAIPIIIKTTLRNANPYVLENLLIGLPIEERKRVSDKVKNELSKISQDLADNFKEPWEEQREKDAAGEAADSSADNQKILDLNPADIKTKRNKEEEIKELTKIKKQIDRKKKAIENHYIRISELENLFGANNVAIEEVENLIEARSQEIKELEEKYIEGIKDIQIEERTKTTPALSNASAIIFDAYVDAIVNELSIDRLTNLIDKIPGANIFKKLLIELSCPRVNTLKSGVQDLFGSLSIEVCDEDAKNYFLPAIPDLPKFKGIGLKFALEKLVEQFKDALVDLISQLVLSLIIRILDLIENGLCNSIGVLGALVANALTGQKGKQGFLDAVNDAFCENEDAREDTANDLLGKAGIPTEKRLEIANALSSAATSNEIKEALISDCDQQNPKVMKAVWAVFKASDLKLNGMFETPDDVRDLFCLMGSYLTDDQRRGIRDSLVINDRPINPSICLTNQERDQWDQNRINFYENQGLDPNAARDFVNGLNNKMNRNLADVLDSLAKGPEGLLEEALQQALAPRDPDCVDATNSIMPPMPAELKSIMDQIAEGVFGSLAFSFTKDMFGDAKSFFDNILADERGIRLSYGLFSHERRVGFDLLYPNAANSPDEHAQKFEEAGLLQKALMTEGEPNHLFPNTIGLYLRKKYEEEIEKDFEITTEMQGKRKKPDLLLQFRNETDIKNLEFDFGFNLAYNHFSNAEVKSDVCSVRKFDIEKSKSSTSKKVDLLVKSSHGVNKYPEQLEKYDLEQSELSSPYVVELFGKVLKDRYSKAEATGLNTSDTETVYNSLNNLIYKGLMQALITDEREENNYPMGYLFGYKDDKITYEDLLYVNPEATDDENTWEYTYEEEDAVLGKSATGNKRVKFLDPVKYGGKYTKPKLYVEQAEHDGWFRIAQTIVPELDGCDPRRTDFLFLNEVSEKVSNLQSKIRMDKRAELEPNCIYEPAYDKFMTPSNHAYMEGIITSTIRAYSLETILRCMPIVSHLKLDFKTNYSDLFSSFIIDKMEDAMQEQGTWPRRIRDYRYWTSFLEQVVQASFRMLDRGDLPKDPELLRLMQQALDVSKSYTRPTIEDKRVLFLVRRYDVNPSGKIVNCEFAGIDVPESQKNRTLKHLNAMAYEAFGKDYRKELLKLNKRVAKFKTLNLQKLKDAEREYDIHENVALAKEILKFHVMKELDFYGDKLEQAFTPQVYINNLSKFLLGASKIAIVSNTQAGLSEIESPVGDSALPNYGTIPSVPDNNESPFANLTEEEILKAKELGGLFLQKYIKVTPNEERTIDLEGMVSFTQFRTAIGNFAGDKTKYISEVFGNAVALPELGTYDGTIGVKMGVRVCYLLPEGIDPFSSQQELLGAAKAIGEDKTYFTNDENNLRYFVPLAHFEQDIIDRTIEEINLDDDNFDEDIKCYFDKMVEQDEFKFIFESLLITNKVSALMAIYAYDGFINSIGLGEGEREDKKEGPNRNIIGMQVGWEGKIMDDTKKRLLDLFSSYYLSHEADNDAEQKRRQERSKFLKNLLPSSIFNFDRNVRWWQLRRWQEDRPFDKDGKDCADTLADVFRGGEE